MGFGRKCPQEFGSVQYVSTGKNLKGLRGAEDKYMLGSCILLI